MNRWRRTEIKKVERFVHRVFEPFYRSRRTTMVALVTGLIHRQKAGLHDIARGMIDSTTIKHRVKRIGRFLSNSGVNCWLASQCLINFLMPGNRRSVVAIDWTDMDDYMLLKATLEFRRRGIPLAWHYVPKWRYDKSQNHEEEQFIIKLAQLIGHRPYVLVADRGFGRTQLFETLNRQCIPYLIRVSGTAYIKHNRFTGTISNIPRTPRMATRYSNVLYRKTKPVKVHLAVVHKEPAPEPWYLVTNLPDRARTIRKLYEKRMSIEEEIRDCKTGFSLSTLQLKDAGRMARMMIIIAIAIALAALTTLSNRAHGRDLQLTNNKPKGRALSFFTEGLRTMQLYPHFLCTTMRGLKWEP